MLKDLLRPNDFLTKIDLKGCLPYCPDMDPSPKIPAIHLAGHSMGVCMSAFQASQCTHTFSKLLKPVVTQLRKMGIRLIIYLDDMLIMTASIEHTTIAVNLLSSLLRVKQREVCLSIYTGTRVPRFSGKFSSNVFVPPKGQGKEYQEGVSVYDKQPFCVNQNTVSTSGKTVLFDTSSLPSTPALPLSFVGQKNGFKENSKLRIHTLSESGSSGRAPVGELLHGTADPS